MSNGIDNTMAAEIEFPDVLFGDRLTTMHNWQLVLRRLWETSSWERALGTPTIASTNEDRPFVILLSDDGSVLDAGIASNSCNEIPCFRAHWITDLTPIPAMPEVGNPLLGLPVGVTDDDLTAYYRSVSDGMRFFWYAIAFFGDSSRIWWCFYEWDPSGKWAIGLLKRMIHWLPETIQFIEQLRIGIAGLAFPVANPHDGIFQNSLWTQIASLFGATGLNDAAEQLSQRLCSNTPVDIMGQLQDMGLIQIRDSGRPELNPNLGF